MINALLGAGKYCYEAASRSVILSVLKDVDPSPGDFPGKAEVTRQISGAVEAFHRETDAIVCSAVEKNQVVLNGPLKLAGVNVYNARCHHGAITTTYFLMYKDGDEDKLLQGNFVLRMQDEHTIATVYRWD